MAQHVINQVHKFLLKKGLTVAIAESCTGGLLSSLLTQISGSSKYFILGAVTYSNKAKKSLLGVPRRLIAQEGAVSQQVAQQMAESIRKIAKTDIGIATTGIAGPTGGSKQKPVGTVFIALNGINKKICERFHFTGSRSVIRKKTALAALELLRNILLSR
ncbi:MAG: CinA family protein [Candidatus Omnitrophica bacterium]|nr:CinA family protein [Candidatus Omnitrophota bacterium]